MAATPVNGSRLVFPRRLAVAVRGARDGSGGPTISNREARWFFGASLTFWTDPRRLTSRLQEQADDGARAFWLSDRFLDGGDWRALIASETDLREHREMRELVRHRADFRAAPAYRHLVRQAASGKPARRLIMTLDTVAAIDLYFEHYLRLIEAIEADGYRDRYALGLYQPPRGGGLAARLKGQHKRNIGVAIGADGGLLRFLGGRHRAAIAQALGLVSVPVEIRLVHAAWLAEECDRSGSEPAEALKAWAAARRPGASAEMHSDAGEAVRRPSG